MKNTQNTEAKIYPAILNCIPDGETMVSNTESAIRETLIRAWDAYANFSKLIAGIYSLNYTNQTK